MTTSQGTTLRQRFVRMVLSLSVSAAVGLAPFLGKVKVPLFTTLLALFPQSIANVAIIFSTATMGIVAAYVQFFGSDRTPLPDIRRKFLVAIRWCIFLLALLLIIYFVTVTRVPFLGGAESASFVTGFTGSRDPRCAQMSSAQCILKVTTFDEANIDAAFGELRIRLAKAMLVIVYVSFMSMFAYAVALIVLEEIAGAASGTNLRESRSMG